MLTFYDNSNFIFFFQFQEKKKIWFYKNFFRFFLFLFHSIPRIRTPIHRFPTLIPRIPNIPTPTPRIPTLIPRIYTMIPRIPTLIPCVPIIPLISFPDSPFRFLQVAFWITNQIWWNMLCDVNTLLNRIFPKKMKKDTCERIVALPWWETQSATTRSSRSQMFFT